MRTIKRLTLLALLALLSQPALADSTPPAAEQDALSPIESAQWTREAAAHLLRRAGFGGPASEIDALHRRGLAGAVAYLVDYQKVPNEGLAPFIPVQHIAFRTHMRSKVKELGRRPTEDEARKIRQEHRRRDYGQLFALKAWWLGRMAATAHPLEERLTLFWHNHFTSGHRDVRNSYHMLIQNALLRRHAAGNFRTFCKAIARDPAMLEYLDNKTNKKQAPNENFARELMELFTLGIGNYTEQDIKQAARAFTGWTFAENRFVNRAFWHDAGVKTVLGKSGRFDGDQVIDILLEQPSSSRYIVGKLFRHFAHEAPPKHVIEGLAKTLRDSNWELRPVLRQLFSSRAFYATPSVATQIKGPVMLMAGTMRTLGLGSRFAIPAVGMADKLGQSLFNPPNVKGWPGGKDWITTSLLLERYNAAQLLVASPRELRVFSQRMNQRQQRLMAILKASQGMDPESMMMGRGNRRAAGQIAAADLAALTKGCSDGPSLVDRLCGTLLATPPSAALRTKLVEYVAAAQAPFPIEKLHGLAKLVVSTPEFQIR